MHNLSIKKKIENAKMQIGVASDLVFHPIVDLFVNIHVVTHANYISHVLSRDILLDPCMKINDIIHWLYSITRKLHDMLKVFFRLHTFRVISLYYFSFLRK